MKPKFPRGYNPLAILRIVGSILTIYLLFIVLKNQGWAEFLSALRSITLSAFLVSFFLVVLSRVFITIRWHILLRSSGISIPFSDTIKISFAGLFATNFLPTTIGGDVLRLAGVIQAGYPKAICTASIVVDRLIGMAGMALMLPFAYQPVVEIWFSRVVSALFAAPHLAFTALHRRAQTLLPRSQLTSGSNMATSANLRKAQVVFQRSQLTSAPHLAISMLPIQVCKWIRQTAAKLFQAVSVFMKNPIGLGKAMLATGVHMLVLFLSIQVLLLAMQETIPLGTIAGIWSITYFITLLPVSINGLGIQEISMSYLFSHFGGISLDHGLVLAILFRALLLLSSIPGAWFLPSLLPKARGTSA